MGINMIPPGCSLLKSMGKGGQYINNFPYLDLIIVSTAKKDITWENEQEIPTLELVSEFILKAI